jgi:hypothetical protein
VSETTKRLEAELTLVQDELATREEGALKHAREYIAEYERESRSFFTRVLQSRIGLAAATLAPLPIYLAEMPLISRFWGWIAHGAAHSLVGRLVAVLLVLSIGVTLYVLRRLARHVYGCQEVAFAIGGAWFALTVDLTPTQALLAVVSVVYFLIRGLDNVYVGMQEHREILNAYAKNMIKMQGIVEEIEARRTGKAAPS